jgi:hypothetical protein
MGLTRPLSLAEKLGVAVIGLGLVLFIGEARRGRPRTDRSAARAPGSVQE